MKSSSARLATLVLCLSTAAGAVSAGSCGDNNSGGPTGTPGPYDGIPLTTTVTAGGLTAPVDVVRDTFGIPHILAATEADAAFANGYMQAGDRLPEMDLLRHFAEGRVAELFGALSPGQIDSDLTMRMHRFKEFSDQTVTLLMASTDPIDKAVVVELQRYADGVNQYATELNAGTHTLDPNVAQFFDPSRFDPWTASDSLAIGYLQQWSLQYDDSELGVQAALDNARTVFDQADLTAHPELAARRGAGVDLFSMLPMDPTSTIDGFPNVTTDSGSRAKPKGARSRALRKRPVVPAQLLSDARRFLRPPTSLFAALKNPKNGSNNWVVGPSLAGGKTILANDPHLQLINPPVWHLLHITVPGQLDVTGVSFPGIPGIILGHNAHVAWGATVVSHDGNDFYLENIAPCPTGGGDCVDFKGTKVPLETFTEDVKVGALGTITKTVHATYELVPHHGPVLPTVANHDIVKRTGNQAISVQYTGYGPSTAVRALYRLNHAASRKDAFDALHDFTFGAQNWVIADDAGSIGWTTSNKIPLRSAGCYTYNEKTNPDGLAPFFVVPGDGSCEWEGFLDDRYVPHAIDPAKGFLASANQDPVGETFDGDALNGPMVDGRPLYAGWNYDPGFRLGRITRRLEALVTAGKPIVAEDLQAIQADAHSNYGEVLRPAIAAAIIEFDEEVAVPGDHAELTAFIASLSPERRARLHDAAARVGAWSLDTPAAVEGTPTAAEIADSTATSIFNFWLVEFLQIAFADEEAALGQGVDRDKAGWLVLAHPDKLSSGIAPDTSESILCDDLTTPLVESCTLDVLVALDRALDVLSGSANGFGTTDVTQWRWGKKHTLTLSPLTPSDALKIPPSDDPNPLYRNGFPRHGDNYGVDAAHPGTGSFDFTYAHGPSMRHVTTFDGPGQPHTKMSLPGGQIFDPGSPHYRDLMDLFWLHNQSFDMPYTTTEIIGKAESHTRFTPPAAK